MKNLLILGLFTFLSVPLATAQNAGPVRPELVDPNMVEHSLEEHMKETNDEMLKMLKDAEKKDFDQTYLAMMIAHHQGAIDMAKLVKERAQHKELKKSADKIISSQSAEIKQMETWQKQWDSK